jgi:hypothetical protein
VKDALKWELLRPTIRASVIKGTSEWFEVDEASFQMALSLRSPAAQGLPYFYEGQRAQNSACCHYKYATNPNIPQPEGFAVLTPLTDAGSFWVFARFHRRFFAKLTSGETFHQEVEKLFEIFQASCVLEKHSRK